MGSLQQLPTVAALVVLWGMGNGQQRALTQNLHGVYLILINFVTDLTHIISGVVRLQVGDLQVVAVHQADSFISGHHNAGRGQHIRSAAPQKNVFACKEEKKGKSVNSGLSLVFFVFYRPSRAPPLAGHLPD